MATPRTKRQFAGASADPAQRQITSFFSTSESPSLVSSGTSRSQIVPNHVQSNLLSVGMRVRKSVPEGYKTGGINAFELWTDKSTTAKPVCQSTRSSSRVVKSSPRELLPFCGINKVGGLDVQSFGSEGYDLDEDDVPAMDSMPELTMSQESVESNVSEPTGKRFFDDDVDDDGGDDEDVELYAQDDVTAGGLTQSGLGNARRMATPYSRRKQKPSLQAMVVGQENVSMNDFEEAGFLEFGDKQMDTTH